MNCTRFRLLCVVLFTGFALLLGGCPLPGGSAADDGSANGSDQGGSAGDGTNGGGGTSGDGTSGNGTSSGGSSGGGGSGGSGQTQTALKSGAYVGDVSRSEALYLTGDAATFFGQGSVQSSGVAAAQAATIDALGLPGLTDKTFTFDFAQVAAAYEKHEVAANGVSVTRTVSTNAVTALSKQLSVPLTGAMLETYLANADGSVKYLATLTATGLTANGTVTYSVTLSATFRVP